MYWNSTSYKYCFLGPVWWHNSDYNITSRPPTFLATVDIKPSYHSVTFAETFYIPRPSVRHTVGMTHITRAVSGSRQICACACASAVSLPAIRRQVRADGSTDNFTRYFAERLRRNRLKAECRNTGKPVQQVALDSSANEARIEISVGLRYCTTIWQAVFTFQLHNCRYMYLNTDICNWNRDIFNLIADICNLITYICNWTADICILNTGINIEIRISVFKNFKYRYLQLCTKCEKGLL